MSAARPEAIDSRLVFRAYAALTISAGALTYSWPMLTAMPRDPQLWFAHVRITAAIVTAFGICAAGFAAIADPLDRRRGLMAFAGAHLLGGAMLLLQWMAVLSFSVPAYLGWAPVIAGFALLYVAITGPGEDLGPRLPALRPDPSLPSATLFAARNKPGLERLRSAYVEQIRQAARQEERARLARDLHDAVKQQLFVVQTAAATAQARIGSDAGGALSAIDQVRTAARDAMSEMEAMLDQLQASPIENAGLVASLRRQCEALGLRTGAKVSCDIGGLPADTALNPGARQAIFRVAQEALSNVARHARAGNVTVSLATVGDRLVLTVQDDGSGFQGGPPGMGMRSMAARAAETGATFEVASQPAAGTTVRFSLPAPHPSSSRPYLRRAAVWAVALLTSIAVMIARGGATPPWIAAIALIAAIGATRHAVAVVRVRRERPIV